MVVNVLEDILKGQKVSNLRVAYLRDTLQSIENINLEVSNINLASKVGNVDLLALDEEVIN